MSAAPYQYWVGIDVPPDTNAAELAIFNQYFTRTHVPEVLALNPAFVRGTRYELAQDDPRGPRGPRFLNVYDIDNEAGALCYIARNDGPPEGRPTYTQAPSGRPESTLKWRLMWHRLVEAPRDAAPGDAPYIFMSGVNAPANANAAELAEFNDFWNEIHQPEVMAINGFQHGVRYESQREFLHPDPGGPRFVVVYDMEDEAAVRAQMERRARVRPEDTPYSRGPLVWERHEALWRLTYRRI